MEGAVGVERVEGGGGKLNICLHNLLCLLLRAVASVDVLSWFKKNIKLPFFIILTTLITPP
jgi:hypothetical protein